MTRLRRALSWLVVVAASLAAPAVSAHPLPNSLVTLKPGFGRVDIEVHAPAPDLAIAMRAEAAAPLAGTTPESAAQVGRYFLKHVALADAAGRRLPLSLGSAELRGAADPDVGRYREWRVLLVAESAQTTSAVFTLTYDAVIHQIPNHVALVRVEGVQAMGRPRTSPGVGVIRYDFAARTIRPLRVDLATGSLASGVGAMIAVGFVHVLSGLDHVLFLTALLMVAPFRPSDGRWRFEGMDRRAIGRFAAISGAFTLGHSMSLAAGTFGFDAVPQRLAETLVAASILVAAIHALRPLFPGREWWVAGGFGLIHGLAFLETLAALDLDTRAKVAALFGFNVGVEAAQLTVMALALPILAISGARAFVRPRQAALVLISLVAVVWVAERGFGLHLPTPL